MSENLVEIIGGIVSIVLFILLKMEKTKVKKLSINPPPHSDCETCPYRKQAERITDEITSTFRIERSGDKSASKKSG
jgi:hypothetical protein